LIISKVIFSKNYLIFFFCDYSLEELHLSLNGYDTVELGQGEADIHDNVKRLHFTGKQIFLMSFSALHFKSRESDRMVLVCREPSETLERGVSFGEELPEFGVACPCRVPSTVFGSASTVISMSRYKIVPFF